MDRIARVRELQKSIVKILHQVLTVRYCIAHKSSDLTEADKIVDCCILFSRNAVPHASHYSGCGEAVDGVTSGLSKCQKIVQFGARLSR